MTKVLDELNRRLNTSKNLIEKYSHNKNDLYDAGYDRAVKDEIIWLQKVIEMMTKEMLK